MLKDQLTNDMKQAMRDRAMDKLGVIRFLLSDIKNYEIDNGPQDDKGIQSIISKQIKQIKDAIADYEKADRQDLVDQEKAKIVVLEAYLPAQMSDEDLTQAVQAVIAANPGMQMGQLIGMAMKQVDGNADGGRVSAMVKQLLS